MDGLVNYPAHIFGFEVLMSGKLSDFVEFVVDARCHLEMYATFELEQTGFHAEEIVALRLLKSGLRRRSRNSRALR